MKSDIRWQVKITSLRKLFFSTINTTVKFFAFILLIKGFFFYNNIIRLAYPGKFGHCIPLSQTGAPQKISHSQKHWPRGPRYKIVPAKTSEPPDGQATSRGQIFEQNPQKLSHFIRPDRDSSSVLKTEELLQLIFFSFLLIHNIQL